MNSLLYSGLSCARLQTVRRSASLLRLNRPSLSRTLETRSLKTSTTTSRSLTPGSWSRALASVSTQPTSLFTTTRSYSSSSFLQNQRSDHESDTEILLFERGSDQYTVMRSGFGFSCFHTAYWIWYTSEFIPTVNASRMSELHIDPMLGVVGVVFAGIIQAIFMVYPRRLVSRLVYKPARVQIMDGVGSASEGGAAEEKLIPAQFWVYTHAIPLIRPALRPSLVIPILEQKDSWSLLDLGSVEAKNIVNQGHLFGFLGRLTLNKPTGFGWPPYILDFRHDSVIPSPDRLFEALTHPRLYVTKGSGHRQDHDDDDEYIPGAKYRRGWKKESRLRQISRQRNRRRR